MSILRSLLIVIVVVAVAFLLLGYFGGLRTRDALSSRAELPQASGTVDRARETGAEIGEKACQVPGLIKDRTGSCLDIRSKLVGDDVGKGSLSKAWRSM